MDKRTIKTKMNIKNSFIKLLGIYDYNSISIKSICDESLISRKTFYYYYDSIYSLTEDIRNDFTQDILEITKDIDITKNIYAPDIIYERIKEILVNFLRQNESILSNNNNYSFITTSLNILVKYIKKTFIDPLEVKHDKEKADIFINYSIHGFVGCYQDWLKGNPRISFDDFSKKLKLIFFNGLNEILVKKTATM